MSLSQRVESLVISSDVNHVNKYVNKLSFEYIYYNIIVYRLQTKYSIYNFCDWIWSTICKDFFAYISCLINSNNQLIAYMVAIFPQITTGLKTNMWLVTMWPALPMFFFKKIANPAWNGLQTGTNFLSPKQWMLHVKFVWNCPSAFGEHVIWKH